MSNRKYAEEFFWMMSKCRKTLSEIPKDCTQGENGVLIYLAFVQDKVSPSELSSKLNVSLPRITSVLNSLESKNLVVKKIDGEDKRKSVVEITAQGKLVVENKKEDTINCLTNIFDKLDEDETATYIKLSEKILNTIIENKI